MNHHPPLLAGACRVALLATATLLSHTAQSALLVDERFNGYDTSASTALNGKDAGANPNVIGLQGAYGGNSGAWNITDTGLTFGALQTSGGGLAAGYINDRRQMIAPHLRVADAADFRIERPAPAEPYERAVTPVGLLLQYNPSDAAQQRVRVRGVVTHHQPGGPLFLRDGAHGLRVEGAGSSARASAGDLVEALGYPEMDAYAAALRDAVFRVVGKSERPEPKILTAKLLLVGEWDNDLVRLQGDLVDVFRSPEGRRLILKEGDRAFTADVPSEVAEAVEFLPGSRLDLTGIAVASRPELTQVLFSAEPRAFTLLLRSHQDVQVLRAPSWWTTTRLMRGAGAVAVLALAALAWGAMLRRRVSIQTAIIQQKTRAEAATEERERIAREFHDTLEQELVGLTLRLDAAAAKVTEPKPRELLASTRRLVDNIQENARSLICNLRDGALDTIPLEEAITRALSPAGVGREIAVSITGEPRPLAALVKHELLRVAQEASANAVKHGSASRIEITLAYGGDESAMRVSDNGCGFDPAREGWKPGHFGLLGMRERISKLGGTFTLQSRAGHGTIVRLAVPYSVSPPLDL